MSMTALALPFTIVVPGGSNDEWGLDRAIKSYEMGDVQTKVQLSSGPSGLDYGFSCE